MRSVAGVIDIVPCNDPAVMHEVISVDITGIAVSVIVLAGKVNLIRIGPHVVNQVRMTPHHAFIHDGHDDGFISGAFLPCLDTSCIKTSDKMIDLVTSRKRTGVAVIPLVSGLRVIEIT